MNYILGSGLIGGLARRILGDSYKLIPFKRSRYYHFDVPWADNFIRFDQKVDDFIRTIIPANAPVMFYKSPFSYRGQLMYQTNPITLAPYLGKVYGDKIPTVADKLIQTTFSVYPINAKELYEALNRKYISEIRENIQFGNLTEIDLQQKTMKLINPKTGEETTRDYETIISTIPLDVLSKFCGLKADLPSRAVCYYVIATESVDLEGAQQCYVCDPEYDFFKVQMLTKHRYVFWTLDVIERPYEFFGQFLNYKIDIQEAYKIEQVIPLGDPPKLDEFVAGGVYCVGSNAQWDDFMDVSSCIKRILSLKTG